MEMIPRSAPAPPLQRSIVRTKVGPIGREAELLSLFSGEQNTKLKRENTPEMEGGRCGRYSSCRGNEWE